jgi:hypothetical protein
MKQHGKAISGEHGSCHGKGGGTAKTAGSSRVVNLKGIINFTCCSGRASSKISDYRRNCAKKSRANDPAFYERDDRCNYFLNFLLNPKRPNKPDQRSSIVAGSGTPAICIFPPKSPAEKAVVNE